MTWMTKNLHRHIHNETSIEQERTEKHKDTQYDTKQPEKDKKL